MVYKIVDEKIETARPPLLEDIVTLKENLKFANEEKDRLTNELNRVNAEIAVLEAKVQALFDAGVKDVSDK